MWAPVQDRSKWLTDVHLRAQLWTALNTIIYPLGKSTSSTESSTQPASPPDPWGSASRQSGSVLTGSAITGVTRTLLRDITPICSSKSSPVDCQRTKRRTRSRWSTRREEKPRSIQGGLRTCSRPIGRVEVHVR